MRAICLAPLSGRRREISPQQRTAKARAVSSTRAFSASLAAFMARVSAVGRNGFYLWTLQFSLLENSPASARELGCSRWILARVFLHNLTDQILVAFILTKAAETR